MHEETSLHGHDRAAHLLTRSGIGGIVSACLNPKLVVHDLDQLVSYISSDIHDGVHGVCGDSIAATPNQQEHTCCPHADLGLTQDQGWQAYLYAPQRYTHH